MRASIKILGIVVALLVITVIPAWAGQGVGSSPYAADLLVSGLNTGHLDPGQEYWYAYSRADLGGGDYDSIILSLNFEAEGRAVPSRLNFQVFNFEQVEAWLKDSSGPVDSLGLGTPASADFDVSTGERLWAGPIELNKVYYVRIFNLSPSPVQFRLSVLGQKRGINESFMNMNNGSLSGQSTIIPAVMNEAAGTDQAVANPLDNESVFAMLPAKADDGTPTSTSWLLAAEAINGLPPAEAAAWLMSAASLGWLPSGSGAPISMPVNPNEDKFPPVGDEGEEETLAEDNSVVEEATELTEPVAPPDATLGESIYPAEPLKLIDGDNVGRLGPKSEHWYKFVSGKMDNKRFEPFSLTMFFTPGDPNIGRNINFQLFSGDQYHIWERGTPDDMAHFGDGAWVSRDEDYATGERLWHGVVVDGNEYFVKITNPTTEWIDYHLITGDINNIEMDALDDSDNSSTILAEATNKKGVTAVPTGKDIGSPLKIGKGHYRGQLEAREDVWFSFENIDPQGMNGNNNYVIELRHTPGAGHVTNYVNIEIYPFQEQHLWRRGDTDKIKPFGAGSDFQYDKLSDTHTWIWDGHLVANTVYFIRIKNDSAFDIDFDLFIKPQME